MSGLNMDVDTCRLATRIPLLAPFSPSPSLPLPHALLFPPVSSTCHWSANWGRQLPCRRFWVMWAGHKTMLGICSGSLIFSRCFLVYLFFFFCLSVANKNLTRSNLLWLNLPSVCVGKYSNWRRRQCRWRKIVWRRLTYDRYRDGSSTGKLMD